MVALGAIIDDAVIDVDAIKRRLRENRENGDERSAAEVILAAAHETRGPVVYATLIVAPGAGAHLPGRLRGGLPGAFFAPLASPTRWRCWSPSIVALTVTPALALVLYAMSSPERPAVAARLAPARRVSARAGADGQPPAVGACARRSAAGARSRWLCRRCGQSMLPAFQDRDLLIHWEGAPGTSLPEMNRITGLVSQELRDDSRRAQRRRPCRARHLLGPVGRRQRRRALGQPRSGRQLHRDRRRHPGRGRRLSRSRPGGSDLPGRAAAGRSERVDRRRRRSALRPGPRRYSAPKAEKIRGIIAGIDGVVDPHVSAPIDEPNVEIEVDLAKAQEFGIKPGDVRRAAATLLSGMEVGNLFEDQKVFEVVVWGAPRDAPQPDQRPRSADRYP